MSFANKSTLVEWLELVRLKVTYFNLWYSRKNLLPPLSINLGLCSNAERILYKLLHMQALKSNISLSHLVLIAEPLGKERVD